jgi:serine/threonine-protein kinase SRK2
MSLMEEDLLAGHPVLRTIRTLGRSGNHIVVLARNVSTGQLVAVKLITRGFDSAQAKYLLRELLNHYELTLAKHPHIVSLLDCFLTPQYLAIVMEYVDGENLQVIARRCVPRSHNPR